MARRTHDVPDDPMIVVIEDDEPSTNFDEWLDLLDQDESTEADLDTVAILREIREHGER